MGVDIGSKHDIHKILQSLADKGLGIIIISDDLPEILQNCSRILIMKGGKVTASLDPMTIKEKELSEYMM
jgi:simple sugar transport system ATP-binding protein